MKINSVKRGNIFTQIESVRTPLSRHNLSYPTRFDCEMGQLIPFYVQDVTPGYNVMAKAGFFGRMMPTISPIMQDIDLEVRYFFVPNRLVWDNFEDYQTRVGDHVHPMIAVDPDENVPYLADLISGLGNEAKKTTHDQLDYVMGLDALPYRAYRLIWNEYFRDENIQNEAAIDADKDGVDGFGYDELKILYCDWKKDYFTSALPWTQRGGISQFIGDVFLKNPSGNKLPQLLKSSDGSPFIYTGINDTGNHTTGLSGIQYFSLGGAKGNNVVDELRDPGQLSGRRVNVNSNADQVSITANDPVWLDPNGSLAVSFTIQELRMANAVQRFLERSALAGNRYTEFIMGMFGVHCADSRLQRPEYLGGGVIPFSVSEVMQNEQAQLDSDGEPLSGSTPQGNLAGIGRVNGVFGFNKPQFFPEFGWIIGICYLRPKALYMNGVNRRHMVGAVGVNISEGELATFENYEIYYNPYFEHIGETAIFVPELFADPDIVDDFGAALDGRKSFDKLIFGYQSQNAFRKFRNGEVHGEFRKTLKHWTLAREFAAGPQLNETFLACKPSNRIFAVEDDSNHFIFEVYNKVDAVLPMSAYGTPSL